LKIATHLLPAPTFSQAFRWFREKYKLSGLIEIGTQEYSFLIFDEKTDSREVTSSMNGTYEEAELACLRKLIEIVKMTQEEIEQYAWENPIFSRKDVYELFNDVFKDKKIEGTYQLSASKQVYEFNSRLRELAKQKVMVKK
jgi:hypothetical protein